MIIGRRVISFFMLFCSLVLTSCSSASKAEPYFIQICADWRTGNYLGSSIESGENLTKKLKSQVDAAISLDPEASAEFLIAVNMMQNVVSIQNQEAEYAAKGFFENSTYFKELSAKRAEEARAEKQKVFEKFAVICEGYTE
jgi:hypothetical protein